MTKIAILREGAPCEARVAGTPETVGKFREIGGSVAVETDAGLRAGITDDAFVRAGATVAGRGAVLEGADLVLVVQAPDLRDASDPTGAALIGMLKPHANRALMRLYTELGFRPFALELLPRTTRAQAMDVLSSQSNLAGYKAVLDAAAEFGRAMPMMMTAAGIIPPARVFVMGAGVAGLQAIATAKRLGAIVSATDIRNAAKEQIESLGAKAIFVDTSHGADDATTGGYATEASEAYRQAQAALISGHIAKQDIVITTALVPGKRVPRLISDAQIAAMRPGSVILDLAVEQGGNVEGAVAGEVVKRHGVTIVGHRNVPSRLAADASALYARNIYNFIAAFWDKGLQRPIWRPEDDLIKAIDLSAFGMDSQPLPSTLVPMEARV